MPDHVGTFELYCLLAVSGLGDRAYGVPIMRKITDNTGKDVVIGSVTTTLRRLEAKGFVESRMGEATPERGGRRKKYYRLTAAGARAMNDTTDAINQMRGGAALPAGA